MGAGAAKQYQSDKTRHAEKVFEAVRAYEAAHPDKYNNEYAHLQGFKTRVQLAAVEAKRKGKEIDSALAQLSDVDLETLRKFVEDSWRQKEEERKRKNENAANEAMTVEEFVEEDPNLNDNAQDETTSVLSYGDGEEGQGEVESDGEIDSSHSLLLGKSKSRDDGDIGESSGEIVEDLELQNDHSVDHGRGAAVKIFPMDAVTDMAGLGYTTPNRKAPNKQQVTVRVDEAKDVGIANALAKFWEIDEVGSIQSQLNLGADSPRAGSFSPFSPDLRSSRRSLESMATRERNKNLDERNERLMGLQRQKVISFTQNAQLEREVEALQRQLERMEELDRVAGIPSGTSSSSVFQAGTPVRLHNSMQSSASTIYNSANNTPIQSTNTSNSLLSNQRSNQSNNHQPSKLSYIYPIDEETNDWNNSLMNTPDAKLVPNQLKPQQRGYYQMARDKKNSITSSSSSDEEPNATKQNGIQQRLKQPVQPSISNNNNVTNGNSSAQSKSKVQSSVSSNRQAGGGRNTRSEDKLNSSPSASSLNNAPASSSQFHFNNMAVADGKNTNNNTTTPQNQDKYSSLAGNMSDVSNSSHVKNSNNRGGRRTRYRTNSNAGDDSDDSTSNNNNKAIFSTPNNNSSNKLFNAGDRRANANNSNANNGMNSNYASDSDTNTNNQVMPLSARGAGGKSISTNNVVNTNSGKKLSTSGTSNAGAGAKMVPTNNSNSNNPTTTATSSSTSLDPSVLNNLNSSPQGHSPLSKRHAEARRARNTIQTESDHKMSPGHSSNNMNNNSNIPQPTGLNRRGISNKNNNNHNDYSEDEQSIAGSKGPSKNTALKRLNKRRHSADGLTDLNANSGHNNNNPQLTPADESQIKALLEKQISDLSQQSPISLHALGKKISNSNNNNRNDGFMDAKRVASLDQADKPNNRQKKHPGALLNPAEHIDDELTHFSKRPSNAPNARQQGSGMLSDHDFDALFAAVDMVPGAELSPGQRQQEVFRHNQTDSSVMSAALATGSQQLPDVSLLNTSTTTNSEDNTGQPLNGHHGHHHGHHGRHHHHHGHHHHHKQQQSQQQNQQQQQQENSNRMMNVEDISPTQTQNKMPPVNNNPGGDVDAITSMASAAAVVNNIQNLKKKGNKASRHHSVSTRQSVGSNNANTNQSNAATEDTAASGVDKNWSDELDHAWAEVSFILRKPIKTEEDMMYTVAAAEAGIIFTDQMNTYAKTLQVLRGALSRWLLPYDNNTRIETQCSTPHSVVENMPDEFRGKLTERQVHYLVAGANEVRKLVRIKIADDNDLEQARQALKTTDAFFKKLYMRAKQLDMSPFELLKKSGTF